MASPDPTKMTGGLPEDSPLLLACMRDLQLRVDNAARVLRSSAPFKGPEGDALSVLNVGLRTVAGVLASAGVVPDTKSFVEQELSGARQRLVDEMTGLLDGKIKELDLRDQKITGREALVQERENGVEAKEREVSARAAALDARPIKSVSPAPGIPVDPQVVGEGARIIEAARAKAQEELFVAQELVAAELRRADELSNANGRTVLEIKRQAVEEMMISMGMGNSPALSDVAPVEAAQPSRVEVIAVTTSPTTASEPDEEVVDESEEAEGDSREPGLGIARHILMINKRLTTGNPAPRDGDDGTIRKHMAKYGAATRAELCAIAQRVVDRHDPRAAAKTPVSEATPASNPPGPKKRFKAAFQE